MELTRSASKNNLAAYGELKRRVRETFILGQQKIEQEKVRTYWKTGWVINEHIRLNGGRAEYGKKVMLKLSGDVSVHESVLRRCAVFAEKFPQFEIRAARHELAGTPRQIEKNSPENNLTWSHYRALITVPSQKRRLSLARRSGLLDWDSRKLEMVIKEERENKRRAEEAEYEKMKFPAPDKNKNNLPTPHKGSLYTYRVVRLDAADPEAPLFLDLGFTFYQEISGKRKGHLKEGAIVESAWRGQGYHFAPAKGKSAADLFTYRAKVERVVDGDTLRVQIDLGFGNWTRQYLRLRDIDTPEIKTKAGEKASAFVKAELKGVPEILLRSSTSDRYDRYLADVFYTVNGEERFLNSRLLETGLAKRIYL